MMQQQHHLSMASLTQATSLFRHIDPLLSPCKGHAHFRNSMHSASAPSLPATLHCSSLSSDDCTYAERRATTCHSSAASFENEDDHADDDGGGGRSGAERSWNSQSNNIDTISNPRRNSLWPNPESITPDFVPTSPSLNSSCVITVEDGPLTNVSLPPVHHFSRTKRKLSSGDFDKSTSNYSPSKCHFAKRRTLRSQSVERVRVPARSAKMSEIPHDNYSWRKYGQKRIAASPYPRGYYKCSGVKGCLAKKHVDHALDDPSMLIVTYKGEHNHPTTL
ncbi:hypothetical protein GOP47_0011680 [Adiantum capillus-veneris]|uniref:WRKY domain-containing protein n=1 Tax=Adiantum capillus-veneris TaxID=13818 RepID=A0A9D4UTP0_ADICA|nr:hypothetical protein GOP47_0011680 [Adiantum capillus-veneris]